jgi:pimeloyl-ACP methyl ester carboxylesterase
MLEGPPMPPIPVMVLAATVATRHSAKRSGATRMTAALSPKGRLELVRSGHFIQKDRPKAVVAAVLSVAAASVAKTAACRR